MPQTKCLRNLAMAVVDSSSCLASSHQTMTCDDIVKSGIPSEFRRIARQDPNTKPFDQSPGKIAADVRQILASFVIMLDHLGNPQASGALTKTSVSAYNSHASHLLSFLQCLLPNLSHPKLSSSPSAFAHNLRNGIDNQSVPPRTSGEREPTLAIKP